jgi:2C-methyl-D-erythritol 2,4-cyclodiphosphate synthase
MSELTAITGALGGVKAALDIAKYIKDSGSTLQGAEQKLKLAELISEIAEIKVKLADVQQIIIDKDLNIRALQEKLNQKENLTWESPCYWTIIAQ